MGWALQWLNSDSPQRVFPPLSAYCFLYFLHPSPLALRIFQHWQKVQESPETSLLHSCSHFHTQSKHGGQLQHLTMLTINHPLDCETQRDMASTGNSGQWFLLSSSFLVFSLILLSDSLFAVLLCFHCCISLQQRTLQSPMLLFFPARVKLFLRVGVCLCCCFSLFMLVRQEKGRPRPSGMKGFNGQKRKRKLQHWLRKTLNQ